MQIILNAVYDPEADPNVEALKLDRIRKRLYPEGRWERGDGGGLEITL